MSAPLPIEDLDFALERTSDLWRRHAGSRLVVTGGTGFIGRWIVEMALRANETLGSGVSVAVITRDAQKARERLPHVFLHGDVEAVEFDLSMSQRKFSLGAIDLCIHAATEVQAPSGSSDILGHYDSIVAGTRHALDACRKGGATRFLLTSTGLVYGPVLNGSASVAETYNGAPGLLNAGASYGNAKRASEWLTSACATPDFAATIARIFTPIGPGLPLEGPFAAGNFVRDAIVSRPIVIRGDVRTTRSYLYTADLAVWLMRILADGKPGEAYNVGSEYPVTIGGLAERIADVTNGTVEFVGDSSGDPDLVQRYVPNTEKARLELNLAQYHSFEEALNKTLAWARSS